MKIKRFRATSISDALEQVRDTLGHDAIILDTLNLTAGGKKIVEVVAAIDEEALTANAPPDDEMAKDAADAPLKTAQGSQKVSTHRNSGWVPTVYGFIGLNGCGKTTALLKFAALLQKRGERVLLVNADQKRLGARETLQKAASLLELPFAHISNPMELIRHVASSGRGHKILVDFPGINFFEDRDLGYLRRYFVALPGLASICVVDAYLHPSDLLELIEIFKEFSPWATLLSKVDQMRDKSRVWEILASVPTSIVYLSKGEKIMSGLEEYYAPRPRLEEANRDVEFETRESISGIHP